MFRKFAFICAGVILTASSIGFAQQPQTPAAPENAQRPGAMRRMQRRGPGMMRRGHQFGLLRQLNLTDEQRAQTRAIIQRHMESIKPQREELLKLREKRVNGPLTTEDRARAKELREQIRSSMSAVHQEIHALLTPEQIDQVQQLMKERRARFGEMRQRRQQLPESKPR